MSLAMRHGYKQQLKHTRMRTHTHAQVSCIVPVGEPIFQPFPHEVIFQGYEPYKTYEATLHLRNNDAVSAESLLLPGSVQLLWKP